MKLNLETPRQARWALIVLMALAAAFRLFLMQWRYAVGFDEPHYLQLAAAAHAMGWKEILHPYWPPMYPICIAALNTFIQEVELAGRLTSLLMGSLTLLPVYYLTQALFDKKSALVAALFMAAFPPLAFESTNALSESTYMFFAISGVAVGWPALQKRSLVKGALAGLCFGGAYLTKPEGIGYLIVFLALAGLILIKVLLKKESKRVAVVVLFAVAGFAAAAFPYLLYLHNLTGQWTLSAKWKVNRYDMNAINHLSPDNRSLPIDMAYHEGNFHEYQHLNPSANDGHAATLTDLAKKIAENLYKVLRFAIPGILTAPLFVLLTLGLWDGQWDRQRTKLNGYLLAYVVFFWLVMVPFFHINDRYLSPLMPICFVWIGHGAVRLCRWLQEWLGAVQQNFSSLALARVHLGFVLFVLMLASFSFLPELGRIVARNPADGEFWEDAIELKMAGQWLHDNCTQTPLIMSYNKAVDFYAGIRDLRRTASFPNDSLERTLAYAANKGVTHLVFDERYAERFPNLNALLDPTCLPKELELVHQLQGPSGHRVLIFACASTKM